MVEEANNRLISHLPSFVFGLRINTCAWDTELVQNDNPKYWMVKIAEENIKINSFSQLR